MLYGVVDTVLTGHASAVDLAAMGLGAGIYSTVFVSLLGALNALNPVIAQHHGARRDVAIGASYVQGLWLAGLLSAGGGLLLAFPERWLAWLHAPSEVDAVVTRYLRVLALGLRASLMFRVISALNVAVARPQVVMRMQVADLVLKVLLSYLLIFGGLGLRLSYALEATSFTFITLLVARLGRGWGRSGARWRRSRCSGASWPRAGPTRGSTRSIAASRSSGPGPAGPGSAS
jgi:Na+-driven multidrug efflux pump